MVRNSLGRTFTFDYRRVRNGERAAAAVPMPGGRSCPLTFRDILSGEAPGDEVRGSSGTQYGVPGT